MTGKRLPLVDRFEAKVVRTDSCWLWTGAVTSSGYGLLKRSRGVTVYAHRLAYEMAHGPVPPGLTVDHLCGSRLCVNPDHFEAVTLRTNILRSDGTGARHARTTRCPQGHLYDLANTYVDRRGSRSCKTCRRTSGTRRTPTGQSAQEDPT